MLSRIRYIQDGAILTSYQSFNIQNGRLVRLVLDTTEGVSFKLVDVDTKEVIAQGFSKNYNYGLTKAKSTLRALLTNNVFNKEIRRRGV